jgi:hypothetical protein
MSVVLRVRFMSLCVCVSMSMSLCVRHIDAQQDLERLAVLANLLHDQCQALVTKLTLLQTECAHTSACMSEWVCQSQ